MDLLQRSITSIFSIRVIQTGEVKVALPERLPSAFVCNNDLAAGKVYDQLMERGYRVPEDISIVGYDNYLFGHPFAEQVTTYNVDMKRMAEIAMKLLMGKIDGKEKWHGTRYVDGAVIERSSVKMHSSGAKEPEITREKAMQAFLSLRAQAQKDFPQGMPLDEINEEIPKTRYGEGDTE